jgi:tRNA-dihydrouridine synthase
MDRNLRELARRLFTVATAILEDATIVAAAGQSHKLTETSCERYARELQLVGHDVATIAEAAATMARLSGQTGQKLPKKHRS